MTKHQLAWHSKTDGARTSRELPDPNPTCYGWVGSKYLTRHSPRYLWWKNSRHSFHFSPWKWNLSQPLRCSFFAVICIQCPNWQNYHPLEDVAGLTHYWQKGIRHLKNVIIKNHKQDRFAWNRNWGRYTILSGGNMQMPWYFKRSFHRCDKNYWFDTKIKVLFVTIITAARNYSYFLVSCAYVASREKRQIKSIVYLHSA